MASNSASCKAWCITLVSAVLVIVADKGRPSLALIAYVPTILFLVLDAYYLALERCFRRSYNEFIDGLQKGQIEAKDVYAVTPKGSVFRETVKAGLSFSVWPFYGTLAITILLAKLLVIG
jgi:hypothetical protein